MTKNRPYFRFTTSELKALYSDNKHDKDVAKEIMHELDHRSRLKAKRLAKQIREDQRGDTPHRD